ncbi:MAG: DNA-directed RNA polymerase subunit alpha [Desulfovibrionaceae bacterium]
MQNKQGDRVINVSNWCSLVQPTQILRESASSDIMYGKFVCEPLERGYGLTLGNALRRVLLSSLQGVAPVSAKINTIQHEFTTIEGVLEDITDIVLNIKQVRFAVNVTEPQKVFISAKKAGSVTAADIVVNHLVKVLNPEQHILTLSEDKDFVCELELRMGKGYLPADMHEGLSDELGIIRLDSSFSPVRKVAYSIEQARVGQMTDYDKLIIEVWTDGSVLPADAIAYSAKIIKEQLTVFVNFDEQIIDDEINFIHAATELNVNLFKGIDDLELSVRANNCLKAAAVSYVGELVQRTEADMLRTKNFGRKSLDEIRKVLQEMGLDFGTKVEDFEKKLQEWKRNTQDET